MMGDVMMPKAMIHTDDRCTVIDDRCTLQALCFYNTLDTDNTLYNQSKGEARILLPLEVLG